ncbi:hypothetical protein WG936_07650 [Corynebacterium sp. H127]|uniref:hypothetical protein n=1 Tax=Corynebacterium sp. H127 TaxID=3133418 RepID=UPI0030AE1BC3
MLDRYEEFFGHRLEKFIREAVPRVVGGLTESERAVVCNASGPFPRGLVQSIHNGAKSPSDQVLEILVVIGSWINASSGSVWAIGPIEDGFYSERVGIGIAGSDGKSFTPLLALVEQMVTEDTARSETLDMIESLAEFNKRQIQ